MEVQIAAVRVKESMLSIYFPDTTDTDATAVEIIHSCIHSGEIIQSINQPYIIFLKLQLVAFPLVASCE